MNLQNGLCSSTTVWLRKLGDVNKPQSRITGAEMRKENAWGKQEEIAKLEEC